jgi:hypothetical protein
MVGKKRLFMAAATLASVGAVIALATGVTFGLFSASTSSGTSSFTAGDVSINSPAESDCTAANMVPGDATAGWVTANSTGAVNAANASEVACTFKVKYTGSAPAYLGLDVNITGTGNGGNGLYDGTATGLQYLIQDDQATPTVYANGHPFTATGGTASGSDLLVSDTPFTTGESVTFTVDYYLPIGAGNSYQDAASSLAMTVHAVQSDHNPEGGTTDPVGHTSGADITWGV